MTGAEARGGGEVAALDRAAVASESTSWRPLGVVLVGTFVIVLDFFIVNVALPSIQRHLGATPAQLEWVVAGYGVTLAVLLITGGRIGDRIGRRLAFCIGVAIFVAASAACGLAPTTAVLIAARLAQGTGAALVSPNVLSIIGILYTGANRVRAITAYGVVMGLAATFGQVIGGLLIQADIAGSAWRTIFLINVPVGIAALLLAPRLVPESKAQIPGRIDIVGIVLVTAGLTAVVLPLVEGRELGWPLWTWLSLAAAPVIFALLVAHQKLLARQAREPFLQPAAFKDAHMRAGLAVQVVCWCSQAAFFLVLSLYLQDGLSLSPLDAGLMFMILAGAYLVVSLRAPTLTKRYGRNLIAIGALTVATGDLALLAAVSGGSGPIAILAPGLLLVGAGQGLWITPLTTTVMTFAEPQRAGMVSGTLSTMQQVGNSLGVAVTGVVFFTALRRGYGNAFSYALIELAAALVIAAVLTRLLPSPPAQSVPATAAATRGQGGHP
jgi:EmrB/QacA subfamily drug resistance transporter